MAGRKNNVKLRFLLLGVIGLVVSVGAFGLILVLAPQSNDPQMVGSILGTIGGVAGALGGICLLLALIKKNPET